MNKLIDVKYESRPRLSLKLNKLTKLPRLIGSPIGIDPQSLIGSSSNNRTRTRCKDRSRKLLTKHNDKLFSQSKVDPCNMVHATDKHVSSLPIQSDMSNDNSQTNGISLSSLFQSTPSTCIPPNIQSNRDTNDCRLTKELSKTPDLLSYHRVLNDLSLYRVTSLYKNGDTLLKTSDSSRRKIEREGKRARLALKRKRKGQADKRSTNGNCETECGVDKGNLNLSEKRNELLSGEMEVIRNSEKIVSDKNDSSSIEVTCNRVVNSISTDNIQSHINTKEDDHDSSYHGNDHMEIDSNDACKIVPNNRSHSNEEDIRNSEIVVRNQIVIDKDVHGGTSIVQEDCSQVTEITEEITEEITDDRSSDPIIIDKDVHGVNSIVQEDSSQVTEITDEITKEITEEITDEITDDDMRKSRKPGKENHVKNKNSNSVVHTKERGYKRSRNVPLEGSVDEHILYLDDFKRRSKRTKTNIM